MSEQSVAENMTAAGRSATLGRQFQIVSRIDQIHHGVRVAVVDNTPSHVRFQMSHGRCSKRTVDKCATVCGFQVAHVRVYVRAHENCSSPQHEEHDDEWRSGGDRWRNCKMCARNNTNKIAKKLAKTNESTTYRENKWCVGSAHT
jgi:hypothetical protein